MRALRQTQLNDPTIDWDPYVVWSGNRLPKYLWDAWKEELKSSGFTWQRFMRLLRYRTDLGVMWYKGEMPWKDFTENVRALIEGPLGRSVAKQSAEFAQNARTVSVPVVGSVAAGAPILAEENIERYLKVSTEIAKPGFKYFVLRVKGDSMDEAGIHDGNLVLVRQQPTAEDGEIVVALIDNDATIKDFHRERGFVHLKPRSTNKEHKPIILKEGFQIQGVVISPISMKE